jgi:DNA-binding LacI/PurR family transcriptional regulator
MFDDTEVARLSMRYFLEHGVKEVAIFPNYVGRFTHKEIHETFKTECERAGIQCHEIPDINRNGISMNEFYRKAAEAFLQLKTATGMAFVTSADMLGVLNELRAQGVDITKYEFIAAFACVHALRYFEKLAPFIDLKHHQLGVMTAKRLLDRIHSFNKLPRTDIVISPELVELGKLG